MSAKAYNTEAAVRKIPLFNGMRDSNYCPNCGKKSGSSIGNHTYSQTHCYHWWHCRLCGRDYDLVIQEHKLPPGMKSPFDKAQRAPKAKAPKGLKGF